MPVANIGREHTWQILRRVVDQLDPHALVADALSIDGDRLTVAHLDKSIPIRGRTVVIAIGKASVPMAAGALNSLGGHVSEAVAVTKRGVPLSVHPPVTLEVLEADHPIPGQSSLDAGRRVREIAKSLGEDDLVLMLISGGGSALVEDLVDGVTLENIREATEAMLRAGATINELNAVRRRLSRIKGGRLASAIAPARVINLIVSDVLGNPLQDIASGPTVEPPDVDGTLSNMLKRDDILGRLPASVREHLEADAGNPLDWQGNVMGTSVIADAETAARTAAEEARHLGYNVHTLGYDFQGEAREFGRFWGTIARHEWRDIQGTSRCLTLIGSGELTVTVRGDGDGGRNTEMALAAAREIDDLHGVTIASFATDGDDGSSGFAGGIVDGSTIDHARGIGIDVEARLRENDTAPVCQEIGAAIDIGPTGTNVNDIYLALVRGD